jgi:excisionase family DNA binding protein
MERWYDSKTVTRLLNVGLRTVQKWAKRGELEFRTVNEGRRRTRFYRAESVERFRNDGPRKVRELALSGPPPDPERKPASLAPFGLFLTLEQASVYSGGLTIEFLRKLIAEGKLFALQGGEGGAWLISRASLENFAGRRRFR